MVALTGNRPCESHHWISSKEKERRTKLIFVTGDIHGSHSIGKFGSRHWPEGRGLGRGDFVIVCGDLGLWWGTGRDESHDTYWRNWLESKPWTTLWVDGNHENHDLLASLPTAEWNGGLTHIDPRWPHIIHLMRGEVYGIPHEGGTCRIFAFGGASSHDRKWRKEGRSWWPQELPDSADFENGKRNLRRCDWEVDYVITHDAPSHAKRALLATFPEEWRTERWVDDRLNGYLNHFDACLSFKKWYFGHYHEDAVTDERHDALYNKIVRIGEDPHEENS